VVFAAFRSHALFNNLPPESTQAKYTPPSFGLRSGPPDLHSPLLNLAPPFRSPSARRRVLNALNPRLFSLFRHHLPICSSPIWESQLVFRNQVPGVQPRFDSSSLSFFLPFGHPSGGLCHLPTLWNACQLRGDVNWWKCNWEILLLTPKFTTFCRNPEVKLQPPGICDGPRPQNPPYALL